MPVNRVMFSSTAGLQPVQRIVLVIGSGCVLSNFFQIAMPLTIFLRFSRNLAHMIYVTIHTEIVEQIFEILISKFLVNFLKFGIGLWNSRSGPRPL